MLKSPIEKTIVLTPRDLDIFQALARYRYLRSTYLHAFVGGASTTRFKERLGDLFHEGYVERPSQQWLFADSRHRPAIYEASRKARPLVAIPSGEERVVLTDRAHRQFCHSVSLCDVVASIEIASLARKDLRFIPWCEIAARGARQGRSGIAARFILPGGNSIVPDAMFGLEYRDGLRSSFRFFALEIDRATMPVVRSRPGQTSYLAKLEAYRDAIERMAHRDQLGLPNLVVLTLTTTTAHLQTMMGSAISLLGPLAPAFLFRSLAQDCLAGGWREPCAALLHEPWQRQGAPALRIDKAA